MSEQIVQVATPPTAQQPFGGIKHYTLEEIARMPIAQFMEIEGRILNGRTQVYYDTLRLAAGTAWTSAQKVRLFTIGREGRAEVANTAAAITKTDFDCNMQKGGEFEHGSTVIIHGIEVFMEQTARLATADAAGLVSNPAPTAKAVNTYSASLLHRVLRRQTKLTFYRGERPQESGLLFMFPTRFGAQASFGGDTEEGIINNSSPAGYINILDFPKVLEGGRDFSILIEPLAPSLDMPADVEITVCLITKRLAVIEP